MKLNFKTLSLLAGALMTLAPGMGLAAGKMIQIKGSDTMLNLGQAWAEAYMGKHPSAMISVTGGGSGTGIAAFLNGTCDICQASRAMQSKEIAEARSRNIHPVVEAMALDGITIAVNSANPIHSLTLEQIRGIYTGKIRNWKEVGGHDGPIVVLSRESTSGTYAYLREYVLKNDKYSSSCLLMPSTKAIEQEVTSNKNAIGYGGLAYFANKKHVKIIAVAREHGGESVEPTDSTIRSKKYPISRPLFMITRGKPTGEVADFIKFCHSEEGQKIVERVGYVTLH